MLGDSYKWFFLFHIIIFNNFLDPTVEELILVTDGCPHQTKNELEDMNTLVNNSGDGISARFQFDVFGFTSSAAVHIHCARRRENQANMQYYVMQSVILQMNFIKVNAFQCFFAI